MQVDRRIGIAVSAGVAALAAAVVVAGVVADGSPPGRASGTPAATVTPTGVASASPVSQPTGQPTPTPTGSGAAPQVEEREVVAQQAPGGSEPGYSVDVIYPALTGLADGAVQQQVNADLERRVEGRIDTFVDLVAELGATADAAPAHELAVRYEVGMVTPLILSVRFETDEYTGGAHGLSTLESVTYDLRTGAVVGYEELFAAGVLEVVSREAVARLTDEYGTGEWAEEGAAPDPELLGTFLITRDAFEVGFDNYQVGPYAIGTPVVAIPWARLRDLVPDGSLLDELDLAG